MSEQVGIFTPPLSPPFVDLTEEVYDNEINNDEEFLACNFEQETLELFNKTRLWVDNNNDSTSSIDSKDFKDYEEEVLDQEGINEIFEDKDEIIDHLEQTRFTPCVIIDFINGKFQRCGETGKLRQLRNLFGTWQVDRDAVKEVDSILSKLGVCDSHFQFDNKYLHKPQNKQTKDFEEGIIQWRRCISCHKYVTYFSRGVGCAIHSRNLNKQNIQVPCIGQYACEALQLYPTLCSRAFNNIKKPQCICCLCYENLGGHIYHRPGKGKKATTCITEKLHADDVTKGLEFLGNLLIKIAQTEDNEAKKEYILTRTLEILIPLTSSQTYTKSTDALIDQKNQKINKPPSLFMIKVLFIKIFKENEIKKNVEIDDFEVKYLFLQI